ncbi:kinesin motor domain-containing protein [Piptocephalis cylindrospora]|uniref:Kinesin motor domain-containing protein n=1 Tax=Piptocephalis cylindrospora TaxID=1907219 RepID=A0A4P9Y3B1_9FUNG|nr:kinesin motor domain-containing protein [Piptocephalis cylindrospora]|eukprot:RKP13174.1 kinesin motor domain-containing protein [Piptocephalis cylindrospora]
MLPFIYQGFTLFCLSDIFVENFPPLQPFLQGYGKVKIDQDMPQLPASSPSSPSILISLHRGAIRCLSTSVSRSRFRDFYFVANVLCLWTIWSLWRLYSHSTLTFPVSLVAHTMTRPSGPISGSLLDAIVPLILFQLQVSRRLYEQCYVERPSIKARMNICLYLLGYFHYFLGVYSMWIERAALFGLWSSQDRQTLKWSDITIHHVLGVLLFLWAYHHQAKQHRILGNLRAPSSTSNPSNPTAYGQYPSTYKIPHGSWFHLVASPHYLSECLIYAGYCVAGGANLASTFLCIWSLTNRAYGARGAHEWYCRIFPNFPRDRRILIPISAPVAFDGSDRSPRPASSSTRPDSVSSSRPVPTRPWLHRRPGPSLMGAATPMTSLRTSLFPMGLDVQGTPMGIPSRKEKTSNIQTFLRVRPGKTSSTLQENNPFLDPPSFLPPHLDIVSEQDIQLSMSPFEKQSGQASSMTGVKKPRQSAPKEQFRFSSIIPPDASHRDMYRKAALPLVKDLLEKNSGSGVLFAYGITNSGKTHALQGGIISTGMEGGKNARGIVQEPGIIPMTLETIFHSLHGHLSPLPHRPLRRTEVEPCPVSSLGTSRVSRLRSRGSRRRTGRRCSLTPADLASLNARSTPASKGNLGTMPPLKEKAFSIWEVPVDGSYEYAVWMSYAEIRGKRVCDLLSPTVTRRRPGGGSGLLALSLRTDKDDQCYIHGLREIQAMSLDEAMAIFRQGRENRTAYSTLLNKDSSRSHAILSIKVLRKKKIKTEAAIAEKEDDERGVSLSQLSFVDLAGAETHEDRLHRPGPAPREVGGINRSLMVFGMCLEAMRSVRNRGDFRKADYIVPFRESQLTHLFQGVFTGRDRASMLVCLNPWDSHQRDMAKVLRFASVAEQPTVPVVEISLGDGPPKNWGRTESPYSMGSNPSASLGILSEEEECEEENAPNCNMHSSASEDEPSSMGGSQENELDINKDDQDSSHGPWFAPTHSTRKRTRRTRKRKRPSPPEEVEEINERNRDEYVKSLVAQNQDLREKWLVSEARLVTLEAEVRDQVVREMEGKMQEMEKRILGAQPMFDRNSSEEDDEGDEDEDEDEDEGGVEDEEYLGALGLKTGQLDRSKEISEKRWSSQDIFLLCRTW